MFFHFALFVIAIPVMRCGMGSVMLGKNASEGLGIKISLAK